jgi:hypothetical protein
MKSTQLSYLSLLLLAVMFVQVVPVAAHTPASVSLDYNFQTQVLTVDVSHGVTDTGSHFIIQIVVEKNSMEFTTRSYTSQSSTTGMTDTFNVPAADGDVLRVTASCNFVGDAVNSLTVSDPSMTTTTTTNPSTTTDTTTTDTTTTGSTTSPTPPTGMDSTVIIIAAVAGIGIIMVILVLVKRR